LVEISRSRDRKALLSEFGKALLKINALKIGTFENSDGDITPYFIDLRKLASFPSAFSIAVDCLDSAFAEKKNNINPRYLCGIPLSGLILGSVLSYKRGIPLIYPSRAHAGSIVGLLTPGSEVLIVEDVSETGNSIKNAIQAIRSSGGVVNHALALIDRMEGADKTLSELGVFLHSFTTTEELALTLKENMSLTDEQMEALNAGTEAIN